MSRDGHGPAGAILTRRLRAAQDFAAVADDRLAPELGVRLDSVVARSRGRLAVAGDHTVAVLAGPTGVGKSSLFNAVLSADIAVPGVTRPTTSEPTAAVISSEPVGELMTHLGLGSWTNVAVSRHPGLESLVLVDLPDHDSVVTAHRARAAEVVAVADRLLWVVDPEKYADASVHEDLLAPLREHAGVLTVVCNRIDRVDPAHRASLLGDLRRLLRAEGLGRVEVVAASAATGTGIEELRALLGRSITEHRAAAERIAADLRALAVDLDPHVPPARGGAGAQDDDIVAAAMLAAGVPTVLEAVGATHLHRARRATGWPPLRRLQARGRNPLLRLGFGAAKPRGEVGTRSNRPLPHGVATAQLGTAVREQVDQATSGWPQAWAEPVDDRLDEVTDHLPARLDRAVAAADLDDTHRPRWWAVVNVAQWAVTVAAAAGALWLLAAFVVDWLRLPALPLYEWRGVPWATWSVLGGVLVGLMVGFLATRGARVGARRARRRVRGRLEDRVGAVVSQTITQALGEEAVRAATARSHLEAMRG